MYRPPKSLWQVLISAFRPVSGMKLSCDDCFRVLEFLADVGAVGGDEHRLKQAVRHHLANCPNCREHHLQRLQALESLLDNQETSSNL